MEIFRIKDLIKNYKYPKESVYKQITKIKYNKKSKINKNKSKIKTPRTKYLSKYILQHLLIDFKIIKIKNKNLLKAYREKPYTPIQIYVNTQNYKEIYLTKKFITKYNLLNYIDYNKYIIKLNNIELIPILWYKIQKFFIKINIIKEVDNNFIKELINKFTEKWGTSSTSR